MPTEKSQSQAPVFSLPLQETGGKTLDTLAALAEANQRVVGQLVELGSFAVTERLRTLGELQSAAMEAARSALAPPSPREAFEEFRHDPLAWYRKILLSALSGPQRVLKLLETDAQIVARSAERFQGSAERSSKEIQDAVSGCVSRLRELYATRN